MQLCVVVWGRTRPWSSSQSTCDRRGCALSPPSHPCGCQGDGLHQQAATVAGVHTRSTTGSWRRQTHAAGSQCRSGGCSCCRRSACCGRHAAASSDCQLPGSAGSPGAAGGASAERGRRPARAGGCQSDVESGQAGRAGRHAAPAGAGHARRRCAGARGPDAGGYPPPTHTHTYTWKVLTSDFLMAFMISGCVCVGGGGEGGVRSVGSHHGPLPTLDAGTRRAGSLGGRVCRQPGGAGRRGGACGGSAHRRAGRAAAHRPRLHRCTRGGRGRGRSGGFSGRQCARPGAAGLHAQRLRRGCRGVGTRPTPPAHPSRKPEGGASPHVLPRFPPVLTRLLWLAGWPAVQAVRAGDRAAALARSCCTP
jgi:hypothetical protein